MSERNLSKIIQGYGGYSLQIWRVVANMLNKYSRIADKVSYSSLGVERGVRNPRRKEAAC